MNFIISILILYLYLNLIIWFLEYAFNQKEKITIFLFSILSGIIILSYINFLNFLNLDFLNFTININIFSFLFFLFWINISLFLINLIYNKNFNIIGINLIYSIFFIIFFIITNKTNNFQIIYNIFPANGEEFLKFGIAYILYIGLKKYKNDILYFSIISGIGFFIIESFNYMISQTNIINTIGIFIIRNITILLHVFYISIPAFFFNSKLFHIGVLIGILFHYIYNLGLSLNLNFLSILVLIASFIWISYIFYNIDRLYYGYKNLTN